MASIVKRKSKSGKISYKVQIRLKDGLPSIYKTFSLKQEAVDWAKVLEAKRKQKTHMPWEINQTKTLSKAIDYYIEYVLPEKPKNARNTLQHLKWWKKSLGEYNLHLISPEIIDQCRRTLLNKPLTNNSQRSPSTVNRYWSSLSIVLSYSVKLGWLKENPALKLSKLTEPKGRDRILSKEEFLRLINAAKSSSHPHIYSIILLAVTTGMRKGEILTLTWDAIDLDQGIIFLNETKNGYPRSVAVAKVAKVEILKLREQSNPLDRSVFPSKNRFGKIDIRKAWCKVLKQAGIENFVFHSIRHLFCTFAAQGGASNAALQLAMGHRSLSMLSRYTHLNMSHVRPLTEYVENTLFGEKNANKQITKVS